MSRKAPTVPFSNPRAPKAIGARRSQRRERPPQRSAASSYRLMIGVIFAIAVLLRIAGVFDEFWLDEIWSLQFALKAHSVLQIIIGPGFHHDNNHWLNTIWMYLLGMRQTWYAYRALSVATGIGMVAAMGIAARRWGRHATLTALLLSGLGYYFVHYSSEARGYAPAAFFAVLAFLALRAFVDAADGSVEIIAASDAPARNRRARARRWAAAVGFWVCCALGFLFQATFLYAFVGALVWTPIALYRKYRKIVPALLNFALAMGVPLFFLEWLYLTAIRGMEIGGGPHYPIGQQIGDALAFALGLPAIDALGWTYVALAVAIAIGCALLLFKRNSDEWIFFLFAGVIAPAAVIWLRHREVIYSRYIFTAMPFLVLFLAFGVSRLAARGRPGRFAAGGLALAFVVGNAAHLWQFFVLGRGHYREAVELMVERTSGPVISVASGQPGATNLVLAYYEMIVPMHGKRIVPADPKSPTPPEWLQWTRTQKDDEPPPFIASPWGTYQLEADYRWYGLSGSRWLIYHRVR